MNEGNTFELEYRVRTKDGRTVWLLDKSQLFTGRMERNI
ncbi:MAG: PAS domain-containing protein [Oscillospiraceae bacterium]